MPKTRQSGVVSFDLFVPSSRIVADDEVATIAVVCYNHPFPSREVCYGVGNFAHVANSSIFGGRTS